MDYQKEQVRLRKLEFLKTKGMTSQVYHQKLLKIMPQPSVIKISAQPQGEEMTYVKNLVQIEQKAKGLA